MAVATHLPAGPDTACAAFDLAARRHADKPFISVPAATAQAYRVAAGDLGHGPAHGAITQLTAAYRRAGYGHATALPCCWKTGPASSFALNALSVSLVPINRDMRAAELEYLIDHSDVVAALAIPSRHGDIAQDIRARLYRNPKALERELGSQ